MSGKHGDGEGGGAPFSKGYGQVEWHTPWWRRKSVIALAILAALYGWWNYWLYPTYEIRYRLAIEVETPQGLKTGSSVIESVWEWHPKLLPEVAKVTNRVTGEAVFVDLGGAKNLVVTLTDNGAGRPKAYDAGWLPTPILGVRGDKREMPKAIRAARAKGAVEVPPANLPTTVTFADLADPKSVQLVDPRDLAASFGDGYRLARATIAITDEPLSEGIEERLGWLDDIQMYRADPKNVFSSTLPALARRPSFKAKENLQ